MTDPHHGRDPQYDEDGDVHAYAGPTQSQFPARDSMRESHRAAGYTARGKFGPREAESTLAFTAAIQPGMALAAVIIEQAAEPYMGRTAAIGVATTGWLAGAVISILLKVAAGFVRNFGESIVRSIGVWLWQNFLQALWDTFLDLVMPRRRRRPEPAPNTRPVPDDYRPPRRRPIIDWINNRRNRGNR